MDDLFLDPSSHSGATPAPHRQFEPSVDIYDDLSLSSVDHLSSSPIKQPQDFTKIAEEFRQATAGTSSKSSAPATNASTNLDLYTEHLEAEMALKEKEKSRALQSELSSEVERLRTENGQLRKNISSLFLTARKELQAKDEEIGKLKALVEEYEANSKSKRKDPDRHKKSRSNSPSSTDKSSHSSSHKDRRREALREDGYSSGEKRRGGESSDKRGSRSKTSSSSSRSDRKREESSTNRDTHRTDSRTREGASASKDKRSSSTRSSRRSSPSEKRETSSTRGDGSNASHSSSTRGGTAIGSCSTEDQPEDLRGKLKRKREAEGSVKEDRNEKRSKSKDCSSFHDQLPEQSECSKDERTRTVSEKSERTKDEQTRIVPKLLQRYPTTSKNAVREKLCQEQQINNFIKLGRSNSNKMTVKPATLLRDEETNRPQSLSIANKSNNSVLACGKNGALSVDCEQATSGAKAIAERDVMEHVSPQEDVAMPTLGCVKDSFSTEISEPPPPHLGIEKPASFKGIFGDNKVKTVIDTSSDRHKGTGGIFPELTTCSSQHQEVGSLDVASVDERCVPQFPASVDECSEDFAFTVPEISNQESVSTLASNVSMPFANLKSVDGVSLSNIQSTNQTWPFEVAVGADSSSSRQRHNHHNYCKQENSNNNHSNGNSVRSFPIMSLEQKGKENSNTEGKPLLLGEKSSESTSSGEERLSLGKKSIITTALVDKSLSLEEKSSKITKSEKECVDHEEKVDKFTKSEKDSAELKVENSGNVKPEDKLASLDEKRRNNTKSSEGECHTEDSCGSSTTKSSGDSQESASTVSSKECGSEGRASAEQQRQGEDRASTSDSSDHSNSSKQEAKGHSTDSNKRSSSKDSAESHSGEKSVQGEARSLSSPSDCSDSEDPMLTPQKGKRERNTPIMCTANLIMLGDEETTCTTFASPSKPVGQPSEFYPPGVRGAIHEGGSHYRHIRGESEALFHPIRDLIKRDAEVKKLRAMSEGESHLTGTSHGAGKKVRGLSEGEKVASGVQKTVGTLSSALKAENVSSRTQGSMGKLIDNCSKPNPVPESIKPQDKDTYSGNQLVLLKGCSEAGADETDQKVHQMARSRGTVTDVRPGMGLLSGHSNTLPGKVSDKTEAMDVDSGQCKTVKATLDAEPSRLNPATSGGVCVTAQCVQATEPKAIVSSCVDSVDAKTASQPVVHSILKQATENRVSTVRLDESACPFAESAPVTDGLVAGTHNKQDVSRPCIVSTKSQSASPEELASSSKSKVQGAVDDSIHSTLSEEQAQSPKAEVWKTAVESMFAEVFEETLSTFKQRVVQEMCSRENMAARQERNEALNKLRQTVHERFESSGFGLLCSAATQDRNAIKADIVGRDVGTQDDNGCKLKVENARLTATGHSAGRGSSKSGAFTGNTLTLDPNSSSRLNSNACSESASQVAQRKAPSTSQKSYAQKETDQRRGFETDSQSSPAPRQDSSNTSSKQPTPTTVQSFRLNTSCLSRASPDSCVVTSSDTNKQATSISPRGSRQKGREVAVIHRPQPDSTSDTLARKGHALTTSTICLTGAGKVDGSDRSAEAETLLERKGQARTARAGTGKVNDSERSVYSKEGYAPTPTRASKGGGGSKTSVYPKHAKSQHGSTGANNVTGCQRSVETLQLLEDVPLSSQLMLSDEDSSGDEASSSAWATVSPAKAWSSLLPDSPTKTLTSLSKISSLSAGGQPLPDSPTKTLIFSALKGNTKSPAKMRRLSPLTHPVDAQSSPKKLYCETNFKGVTNMPVDKPQHEAAKVCAVQTVDKCLAPQVDSLPTNSDVTDTAKCEDKTVRLYRAQSESRVESDANLTFTVCPLSPGEDNHEDSELENTLVDDCPYTCDQEDNTYVTVGEGLENIGEEVSLSAMSLSEFDRDLPHSTPRKKRPSCKAVEPERSPSPRRAAFSNIKLQPMQSPVHGASPEKFSVEKRSHSGGKVLSAQSHTSPRRQQEDPKRISEHNSKVNARVSVTNTPSSIVLSPSRDVKASTSPPSSFVVHNSLQQAVSYPGRATLSRLTAAPSVVNSRQQGAPAMSDQVEECEEIVVDDCGLLAGKSHEETEEIVVVDVCPAECEEEVTSRLLTYQQLQERQLVRRKAEGTEEDVEDLEDTTLVDVQDMEDVAPPLAENVTVPTTQTSDNTITHTTQSSEKIIINTQALSTEDARFLQSVNKVRKNLSMNFEDHHDGQAQVELPCRESLLHKSAAHLFSPASVRDLSSDLYLSESEVESIPSPVKKVKPSASCEVKCSGRDVKIREVVGLSPCRKTKPGVGVKVGSHLDSLPFQPEYDDGEVEVLPCLSPIKDVDLGVERLGEGGTEQLEEGEFESEQMEEGELEEGEVSESDEELRELTSKPAQTSASAGNNSTKTVRSSSTHHRGKGKTRNRKRNNQGSGEPQISPLDKLYAGHSTEQASYGSQRIGATKQDDGDRRTRREGGLSRSGPSQAGGRGGRLGTGRPAGDLRARLAANRQRANTTSRPHSDKVEPASSSSSRRGDRSDGTDLGDRQKHGRAQHNGREGQYKMAASSKSGVVTGNHSKSSRERRAVDAAKSARDRKRGRSSSDRESQGSHKSDDRDRSSSKRSNDRKRPSSYDKDKRSSRNSHDRDRPSSRNSHDRDRPSSRGSRDKDRASSRSSKEKEGASSKRSKDNDRPRSRNSHDKDRPSSRNSLENDRPRHRNSVD